MVARTPSLETARVAMEADTGEQFMHLVLAAGYMWSAGMPGCAASILLAAERLAPDKSLAIIGWRVAELEPEARA